jgi:hypothetical protein
MAKKQQNFSMGMEKQPSLFSILDEESAAPAPASLNIGAQVREKLSAVLKAAPCKRWEVAGRMGEYLGIEITESQLNAWCAESKDGYRFPLEYLPALCYAASDYGLADMVVKSCGCQLIKSEEVILLELARIDDEARQREEEARRRDERKTHLLRYLEQLRGGRAERQPSVERSALGHPWPTKKGG